MKRLSQLAICLFAWVATIAFSQLALAASATDTESFTDQGSIATPGLVQYDDGGGFGDSSVNFYAHFAKPGGPPPTTAMLQWSYTTADPGLSVEVIAYNTSSASIPARTVSVDTFPVSGFYNTGISLGTFAGTGAQSTANIQSILNNNTNFPGTHWGFEFRVTGTSNIQGVINFSGIQLVVEEPTANITLAAYSTNAGGTYTPSAITATGTTDGTTAPGASNVRWTVNSGTNVQLSSTTLTPGLTLANLMDAGLANTLDNATLTLTIDKDGNFGTTTDQAVDTATINYTNALPSVTSLAKSADFSAGTASVTITPSISDADAALNGTDLNGATAGGVVPTNFEQFQYSYTLDGVVAGTTNTGSGTNPIVPGSSVTLAQALAQGLAPNSTVSVQLGITDRANAAASNSLVVSYTNALPNVSGVTKVSDGLGGLNISATTTDADLAVAFATYNEQLTVQAFVTNGTTNTQVGNVVLEANGTPSFNISAAALTGYLSSGFLNYFFRATDTSGAVTNSALFPLQNLAVPEPATVAIWSVLGLAAVGYVVRRKKK